MKDKLAKLFKMQQALDDAIFAVHEKPDRENVLLALFDELGEVCHAKKGSWCYWKFSQKPVNDQELLEELADVLHFVLSYILHYGRPEESVQKAIADHVTFPEEKFFLCLRAMVVSVNVPSFLLVHFLHLVSSCGFTFDHVYKAYLLKNEKNFSRLEAGY